MSPEVLVSNFLWLKTWGSWTFPVSLLESWQYQDIQTQRCVTLSSPWGMIFWYTCPQIYHFWYYILCCKSHSIIPLKTWSSFNTAPYWTHNSRPHHRVQYCSLLGLCIAPPCSRPLWETSSRGWIIQGHNVSAWTGISCTHSNGGCQLRIRFWPSGCGGRHFSFPGKIKTTGRIVLSRSFSTGRRNSNIKTSKWKILENKERLNRLSVQTFLVKFQKKSKFITMA